MNVNFEHLELIPRLFDELRAIKDGSNNLKKWLTVAELAEYIDYSKDRIHALCKSEFIEGKHFYKRGKLFFDREQIDKWIMSGSSSMIEPKDIVNNILKDLI